MQHDQGLAAPGTSANTPRPKVVVVTGPTAVGKTAISLLLAQRLRGAGGGPGEVISADSVQVYRGLDVGSDKLPVDEREGVPHHLIDIRDWHEDFSSGDFYDCARPVAHDILQRGGVPLVVGGTGLYLKWFMLGKGGAPRATPEALQAVAAAMEAEWQAKASAQGGGPLAEEDKWEAAAALLLKWGDPQAYERIRAERNNYYRLERALVILHMNPGAKLADFAVEQPQKREQPQQQQRQQCGEQGGQGAGEQQQQQQQAGPPPQRQLEYDFRCFFLHRPRLQLYDRIAGRIEQMLLDGGGLLREAAGLLRAGIAPGQNMAAKAIGYRQAMEWLVRARQAGRPVTAADVVDLHATICHATHKLVRSQMTWFRDEAMYKWIDVTGREASDVVDEIMASIDQPEHEGGCGDSGRLTKEEQKAIIQYRPTMKLMAGRKVTDPRVTAEMAPLLDLLNSTLLPSLPQQQQQPPSSQEQPQQKRPDRQKHADGPGWEQQPEDAAAASTGAAAAPETAGSEGEGTAAGLAAPAAAGSGDGPAAAAEAEAPANGAAGEAGDAAAGQGSADGSVAAAEEAAEAAGAGEGSEEREAKRLRSSSAG